MSEKQWMPLRCASCSGLFKVSADDADSVVECPHCQSQLAAPSNVANSVQVAEPVPEATVRRPGKAPRPIQAIPTESDIPKNLKRHSAGGVTAYLDRKNEERGEEVEERQTGRIPRKKEGSGYTPPEMIVMDSNAGKDREPARPERKDQEEKAPPKLNNPDRIASTADAKFAVSDSDVTYQRQRVMMGGGAKKADHTGWDRESGEQSIQPEVQMSPFMRIVTKLKRPFLWLLVLLFAGLVVYGVISMNSDKNLSVPVLERDVEPEIEEPTVADELGKENLRLTKMAQDAMLAFLNAKTVEERLDTVRDRERVEPLIRDYYTNHDVEINYRKEPAIENAYTNFVMAPVELEDFSKVIMTAERVDDVFKVDWESFVKYSEMEFEVFKEEQVKKPVLFRVKAFTDNYFNFGFDEQRYLCVRIEDQDSGLVLYGYALRASETGRELMKNMVTAAGYVVLKLRFPEDAKSDNQVIVDEFVQRGWVIREMEEEELKIDDIAPPSVN